MKSPLHYSFAIVAALCATALGLSPMAAHSAPVAAQVQPTATARQISSLQINNKNGLVTVQDKGGAFLFANVITTKNLNVSLSKPANSRNVQVVLSDEKNKKIWQTSLGDGGHAKFSFNFNWTKNADNTVETKGIILTLTPEESVAANEIVSAVKGSVVLAGDGCPNAMNIDSGDNRIVLTRDGNKFVVTNYENGKTTGSQILSADGNTSTVELTANGKTIRAKGAENGVTVSTGTGTLKVSTITRDGKAFVDIDLGSRHILIEGGNYKFNTEGDDIIVTHDPGSK